MLRRATAALCAGTAAVGILGAVRAPTDGPTTPVLVARQVMAAGQVPAASTVRVARWPLSLVPSDALDSLARVEGRPVSAVVSPGEPITERRLSTSALLDGQPPGTVAVHVALADPGARAMVSAGDRVDLVGSVGIVARGVLVLRTDDVLDASSVGLVPSAPAGAPADGPVGIVVAAGHETAEAIARTPVDAMGRPALTLLLRAQ